MNSDQDKELFGGDNKRDTPTSTEEQGEKDPGAEEEPKAKITGEAEEEPKTSTEQQKPMHPHLEGDCGLPEGCMTAAEMEAAMVSRRAADEDRERMLMRAAIHVRSSRVQRLLYQYFFDKAVADAKANVPHRDRTYTLVADFGQNMELPVFNEEQPGCTYYYSPLSVYNFGIVDHAHDYGNGEFKEHMHAHVYHEGVGRKGANNVASLIMKTLRKMGILRENDIGGELTNIFDTCTSQNKNNTVMKLLTYLGEMGYFKKVNFIFLVVGHTKNSADHLFNILKKVYRKSNIYTMDDLMAKLNESECVTVHPVEEDFQDWDEFLSMFYRDFSGEIKQNHIFSASSNGRDKNQFSVNLRESNLPEHKVKPHGAIKQTFHGRRDYPNYKTAVYNRGAIMAAARPEHLKQIDSVGINIFMLVEL